MWRSRRLLAATEFCRWRSTTAARSRPARPRTVTHGPVARSPGDAITGTSGRCQERRFLRAFGGTQDPWCGLRVCTGSTRNVLLVLAIASGRIGACRMPRQAGPVSARGRALPDIGTFAPWVCAPGRKPDGHLGSRHRSRLAASPKAIRNPSRTRSRLAGVAPTTSPCPVPADSIPSRIGTTVTRVASMGSWYGAVAQRRAAVSERC